MKRFNKILVANRGEIACRILRTCSAMGIASVAVYSDADREASFVAMADEAVHIGAAASAESYLRIDAIIAAAQRCGADAIHPGYGFLAENAAFASACAAANIVFIGPSASVIELLGSKKASKEMVQAAGVPIVPSYDEARPDAIEYPILLKASAGGGGKGMQIVRSAGELAEALESAKRVALRAFGDDTMLLERYVEAPRHIEIQILGDSHGNIVHLFERECSIQRRHQKIIEESPAANLSSELRDKIASAAVAVGRAAGYENAGTVEFILAPNGEFYFLEVNTRLQVEHPVTECVTGLDLVREQIRIAQGEALGYQQSDLEQRGAAIECRLYAEDCDKDFLPSSGRLLDWHVPTLLGLRVDGGVDSGSEISIHYDPMIAKLVAFAPTRSEALAKLRRALAGLSAAGLTTNRDYLDRILAHPAFAAAELDTGFLQRHAAALVAPAIAEDALCAAAMAATALACHERAARRDILPHMTPGFRNSRWREEQVSYRFGDRELTIAYLSERDGSWRMRVLPSEEDRVTGQTEGARAEAGQSETAQTESAQGETASLRVELVSCEGRGLILDLGGHRRRFRITREHTRAFVLLDGREYSFDELPRFPVREVAVVQGACVAPMPATVVKVSVANGDSVSAGDTLLILEAMKMEHRIKADRDGIVSELRVVEGDQVADAQLLAVVAEG